MILSRKVKFICLTTLKLKIFKNQKTINRLKRNVVEDVCNIYNDQRVIMQNTSRIPENQ